MKTGFFITIVYYCSAHPIIETASEVKLPPVNTLSNQKLTMDPENMSTFKFTHDEFFDSQVEPISTAEVEMAFQLPKPVQNEPSAMVGTQIIAAKPEADSFSTDKSISSTTDTTKKTGDVYGYIENLSLDNFNIDELSKHFDDLLKKIETDSSVSFDTAKEQSSFKIEDDDRNFPSTQPGLIDYLKQVFSRGPRYINLDKEMEADAAKLDKSSTQNSLKLFFEKLLKKPDSILLSKFPTLKAKLKAMFAKSIETSSQFLKDLFNGKYAISWPKTFTKGDLFKWKWTINQLIAKLRQVRLTGTPEERQGLLASE